MNPPSRVVPSPRGQSGPGACGDKALGFAAQRLLGVRFLLVSLLNQASELLEVGNDKRTPSPLDDPRLLEPAQFARNGFPRASDARGNVAGRRRRIEDGIAELGLRGLRHEQELD